MLIEQRTVVADGAEAAWVAAGRCEEERRDKGRGEGEGTDCAGAERARARCRNRERTMTVPDGRGKVFDGVRVGVIADYVRESTVGGRLGLTTGHGEEGRGG